MKGVSEYEEGRSCKNCRGTVKRRPNLAFKRNYLPVLAGVQREAGGIL